MTKEEAKGYLAHLKRWQFVPDNLADEALDMAIASLEAWEKVRQEINDLFSKPACYIPNYDAYKMFLEIIDRHLQKASPTGAEGSDKE